MEAREARRSAAAEGAQDGSKQVRGRMKVAASSSYSIISGSGPFIVTCCANQPAHRWAAGEGEASTRRGGCHIFVHKV